MFFVATAPEIGGHINLSPKGPIESLQVLDRHTIAYLDLIGSGAETVAHLRQNGRICVMLCAFQGRPRILRMHGRGTVLAPGCDRFDQTIAAFDLAAMPAAEHAARSIILVELERIADSCGFDVPLMIDHGHRPQRAGKAVAHRRHRSAAGTPRRRPLRDVRAGLRRAHRLAPGAAPPAAD